MRSFAKGTSGVSLIGACWVIVLVCTLSIFGAYVSFSLSPKNRSSQSTSSYLPAMTNATNSALGLMFTLSINSTVITSGDSINVALSLYNTLSKVNNVSAQSDWAFPVLSNFSASAFPCPNWENFLIFNGSYDKTNISSAVPLYLFPVGYGLACPFLNWPYFVFQPLSSNVTVGGAGFYNYGINETTSVKGYYTTSENTENGTLPPPPFPSGVYTVIAGDEWGDYAILHFAVS
jgi:hypothetical protein